jgi:hypothetical protein
MLEFSHQDQFFNFLRSLERIAKPVLILAYPGSGVRNLFNKRSYLVASDSKALHLDSIGYRSNSMKYFSDFIISEDLLKWRLFKATYRHRFILCYGWGTNWEDILKHFSPDSIFFISIDEEQYLSAVESYRLTDEYQNVDLAHIKFDAKSPSASDRPIEYYLWNYIVFLNDASQRIGDSNRILLHSAS